MGRYLAAATLMIGMVAAPSLLDRGHALAAGKAKAEKAQPAADGEAKAVDPEVELEKALGALAKGRHAEAGAIAGAVLGAAKGNARATARALAIRGRVALAQGRAAEAMADLDTALWVKGGLAGRERDAAAAARGQAYGQAGVAAGAGASPTAAPPAPSVAAPSLPPTPAPRQPNAVAKAERAIAAPPAAEPETGSSQATGQSSTVGGILSSLFGGGGGKAEQEPAKTTAALPPPARPPATSSFEAQRVSREASEPAAPRAVKPWTTATAAVTPEPPRAREPAPAPEKPARKATASVAPAVVAPVAPAADAGASAARGAYELQLGAVKTRPEAEAMAARVRKTGGQTLASRSYRIDEASYGNMGTFYRVRIGPFPDAGQSQAICASIRNSGVDCMVTGE